MPIDAFVRRHPYIAIFELADIDADTVTAFVREHFERATPFDPYFDNDDQTRLYCTQFVALALEAGGLPPVISTPRRDNRSMRVVLEWLRIRGRGTIQADTLVRRGRQVAMLSLERTATQIRVTTAAKRELHRRFTCDQRLGHVFRPSLEGIEFRAGVQLFLNRAGDLFRDDEMAPEPTIADAAVRTLADDLFGPMPNEGRSPLCVCSGADCSQSRPRESL